MVSVFQSFYAFVLALIVFVCNITSTLGISNNKQSDVLDGGIRIVYGDKADENLDMFVPQGASGEVNVIVLIHGGGWTSGTQTGFGEQETQTAQDSGMGTASTGFDTYAKAIADNYGYVGVSLDYTKLTEGATAIDMVNEIGDAMTVIKNKLSDMGIDAQKVAIVGHSAGAHLTLLYSYQHYQDCPMKIAFAMANCPPSDFLDNGGSNDAIMQKYRYIALTFLSGTVVTPFNLADVQDAVKAVSPIDNVTSSVPPTLIVAGAKDTMVPYTNSTGLYAALQKAGVPCDLLTYPNSGHFLTEDHDAMQQTRSDLFFKYCDTYLK